MASYVELKNSTAQVLPITFSMQTLLMPGHWWHFWVSCCGTLIFYVNGLSNISNNNNNYLADNKYNDQRHNRGRNLRRNCNDSWEQLVGFPRLAR